MLTTKCESACNMPYRNKAHLLRDFVFLNIFLMPMFVCLFVFLMSPNGTKMFKNGRKKGWLDYRKHVLFKYIFEEG